MMQLAKLSQITMRYEQLVGRQINASDDAKRMLPLPKMLYPATVASPGTLSSDASSQSRGSTPSTSHASEGSSRRESAAD
jgi:hypothetical protein